VTRARDLLVAPVCGDQPIEGWLEVLDPMLYPPVVSRGNSDPLPGCPAFGADSVLERGPEGMPPAAGSVRPGLHRPVDNGPPVVWWDPAKLMLDVEEQAPLRHQRILEMDPEGAAAAAGEKSYAAWREARRALLARASQPSLSVRTVSSLAFAGADEASHSKGGLEGQPEDPAALLRTDVGVEIVERGDFERPGGRRFGALVHAMLASIDFDANADAIQASAAINGRVFGAIEEEIQAAIVTVGIALRHPILRRAAASAGKGGLRRETPVLLALDDGSLVEGVVDLAFREDAPDFAGWTVVDFKTDREFAVSSACYLAQVRVYSEAVRVATDAAVRGIVLVF
jgi:ATP-dependent helicase/nuclease subunit A